MTPAPLPKTMTETAHTPTPSDLAKRVGTLFVLAMQTNDAELRQAAHIDKSELGMKDGPVFLPIERLTEENERLRKCLADVVADVLEYERINNLSPNPGRKDCWDSITRARSALTPTDTAKE